MHFNFEQQRQIKSAIPLLTLLQSQRYRCRRRRHHSPHGAKEIVPVGRREQQSLIIIIMTMATDEI